MPRAGTGTAGAPTEAGAVLLGGAADKLMGKTKDTTEWSRH